MPTLFRPCDPHQQFLLPPSLLEWLPSDHLLWFISETVDQLSLDAIVDVYRESGQGNLPYHPAMMLKLLIYAYSSGVFSSPRIARQIDENVAFRVLAAGHRPDHRTICRFRERHLDAFEGLFVQVVQIARNARTKPRIVLADAGYASEENLVGLEQRRIDGYVALGREGKTARVPKADAHATKRMAAKLKRKRGRQRYKQRKHIAEPPFGWMKRVGGLPAVQPARTTQGRR